MTGEPDDQELMAFVDDELDAVRRSRVEKSLARNPALRERLDALNAPGAALRAALDPVAREPIPAALLQVLVGKRAAHAADRPQRSWQQLAAPLAMAASLALVVGGFGGAWLAGQQHRQPARSSLVWLGALDPQAGAVLDNLPSGAIGVWRGARPDIELQPVLSFRDAGGRVCRQFVARGATTTDALACRAPDGAWHLTAALARVPPAPALADGYRPAGGDAPAPIDVLVDTLAVEPLTPRHEAELLRRQWRVPSAAD